MTDIIDKEYRELIEEAIKKYPVGTRFNSTGGNLNCIMPENVYLCIKNDCIVVCNFDKIKEIGRLYNDNMWAEILELPKEIKRSNINYMIFKWY